MSPFRDVQYFTYAFHATELIHAPEALQVFTEAFQKHGDWKR